MDYKAEKKSVPEKAGRKGHKKAKGSRKGASLKKRPMDGCTVLLIFLLIAVVAFIALGIFWGWTNTFYTMLVLVAILWMIFVGNDK